MNVTRYISPKVSDRVKEVLWDSGISCRKLANLLNCSASRSQKILSATDRVALTAEEIRIICIQFRVNPSWLLGLETYNL